MELDPIGLLWGTLASALAMILIAIFWRKKEFSVHSSADRYDVLRGVLAQIGSVLGAGVFAILVLIAQISEDKKKEDLSKLEQDLSDIVKATSGDVIVLGGQSGSMNLREFASLCSSKNVWSLDRDGEVFRIEDPELINFLFNDEIPAVPNYKLTDVISQFTFEMRFYYDFVRIVSGPEQSGIYAFSSYRLNAIRKMIRDELHLNTNGGFSYNAPTYAAVRRYCSLFYQPILAKLNSFFAQEASSQYFSCLVQKNIRRKINKSRENYWYDFNLLINTYIDFSLEYPIVSDVSFYSRINNKDIKVTDLAMSTNECASLYKERHDFALEDMNVYLSKVISEARHLQEVADRAPYSLGR